MNSEQLEKLAYINGEVNAAFKHMDVDVRRVKARQSGANIVTTIEFTDGSTKYFDAAHMTHKQIVAYMLTRV